jgi:hypothetical protein
VSICGVVKKRCCQKYKSKKKVKGTTRKEKTRESRSAKETGEREKGTKNEGSS